MDPRRSEAAKKAWRTRRAKPSPAQGKVLKFLEGHPVAKISVSRWGKGCISHVGFRYSGYGYPRINRTVWRAILKRKWIAKESSQTTGGLMGTLPDGTQGIVEPSYDDHYVITEKGRKALHGLTSTSPAEGQGP
jgi:hypothetical protein